MGKKAETAAGAPAKGKKVAPSAEPVAYADRGWWFCVEMDATSGGDPPYQAGLLPNGTVLMSHGSHVFRHILRKEQMHLVKALTFALEPSMRFYLCGRPVSFDEAKKVVGDESRWGSRPA